MYNHVCLSDGAQTAIPRIYRLTDGPPGVLLCVAALDLSILPKRSQPVPAWRMGAPATESKIEIVSERERERGADQKCSSKIEPMTSVCLSVFLRVFLLSGLVFS